MIRRDVVTAIRVNAVNPPQDVHGIRVDAYSAPVNVEPSFNALFEAFEAYFNAGGTWS